MQIKGLGVCMRNPSTAAAAAAAAGDVACSSSRWPDGSRRQVSTGRVRWMAADGTGHRRRPPHCPAADAGRRRLGTAGRLAGRRPLDHRPDRHQERPAHIRKRTARWLLCDTSTQPELSFPPVTRCINISDTRPTYPSLPPLWGY